MPSALPELTEAEEQEMIDFVKSWPFRERSEIINWLSGALVGHAEPLSHESQRLLQALRARFPESI